MARYQVSSRPVPGQSWAFMESRKCSCKKTHHSSKTISAGIFHYHCTSCKYVGINSFTMLRHEMLQHFQVPEGYTGRLFKCPFSSCHYITNFAHEYKSHISGQLHKIDRLDSKESMTKYEDLSAVLSSTQESEPSCIKPVAHNGKVNWLCLMCNKAYVGKKTAFEHVKSDIHKYRKKVQKGQLAVRERIPQYICKETTSSGTSLYQCSLCQPELPMCTIKNVLEHIKNAAHMEKVANVAFTIDTVCLDESDEHSSDSKDVTFGEETDSDAMVVLVDDSDDNEGCGDNSCHDDDSSQGEDDVTVIEDGDEVKSKETLSSESLPLGAEDLEDLYEASMQKDTIKPFYFAGQVMLHCNACSHVFPKDGSLGIPSKMRITRHLKTSEHKQKVRQAQNTKRYPLKGLVKLIKRKAGIPQKSWVCTGCDSGDMTSKLEVLQHLLSKKHKNTVHNKCKGFKRQSPDGDCTSSDIQPSARLNSKSRTGVSQTLTSTSKSSTESPKVTRKRKNVKDCHSFPKKKKSSDDQQRHTHGVGNHNDDTDDEADVMVIEDDDEDQDGKECVTSDIPPDAEDLEDLYGPSLQRNTIKPFYVSSEVKFHCNACRRTFGTEKGVKTHMRCSGHIDLMMLARGSRKHPATTLIKFMKLKSGEPNIWTCTAGCKKVKDFKSKNNALVHVQSCQHKAAVVRQHMKLQRGLPNSNERRSLTTKKHTDNTVVESSANSDTSQYLSQTDDSDCGEMAQVASKNSVIKTCSPPSKSKPKAEPSQTPLHKQNLHSQNASRGNLVSMSEGSTNSICIESSDEDDEAVAHDRHKSEKKKNQFETKNQGINDLDKPHTKGKTKKRTGEKQYETVSVEEKDKEHEKHSEQQEENEERERQTPEAQTSGPSLTDAESESLASLWHSCEPNADGVYRCKLCDISSGNTLSFMRHLNSEWHKDNMNAYRQQTLVHRVGTKVAPRSAATHVHHIEHVEPSPALSLSEEQQSATGVDISQSKTDVSQETPSKSNVEDLDENKLPEYLQVPQTEGDTYRCTLCQCTSQYESSWQFHLKSLRHKEKVRKYELSNSRADGANAEKVPAGTASPHASLTDKSATMDDQIILTDESTECDESSDSSSSEPDSETSYKSIKPGRKAKYRSREVEPCLSLTSTRPKRKCAEQAENRMKDLAFLSKLPTGKLRKMTELMEKNNAENASTGSGSSVSSNSPAPAVSSSEKLTASTSFSFKREKDPDFDGQWSMMGSESALVVIDCESSPVKEETNKLMESQSSQAGLLERVVADTAPVPIMMWSTGEATSLVYNPQYQSTFQAEDGSVVSYPGFVSNESQ